MTTQALLTWAYDGSGIALRAPVTCHRDDCGQVLISLTISSDNAQMLRALTTEYKVVWLYDENEAEMWVPAYALTPIGSLAPTEAWNWND